VKERRAWIELCHPGVPVSRQCALLKVSRSSAYYTPNTSESDRNLALMRRIDELYLKFPFYGVPRMTWLLNEQGCGVNRKRVARLMRVMGLQATMPGPHTSKPHPEHRIYPYLLRGMEIDKPCEVWSADITYIPMRRGFMYLVAVMDWFSRYVIAWDVSNSMESGFCVSVIQRALRKARPAIFNTDQGSQFTSEEFTGTLLRVGVRISMDGRGRALDNVFIERLWRSVKYEDIYLREYADGHQLHAGLARYFRFYNHERPHSALGNQTPALWHKRA
jgi:putative transposase